MFYALQKHEDFWAERLNLFVALAPVTRLDHTTSLLFKYFAGLGGTLSSVLGVFGIYDMLGQSSNWALKIICKPLPFVCEVGEGFFITQNPKIDDKTRFNDYMGHFPAGASVKSIDHYSQLITSKHLQEFDYGKKGNLEHYGQETPLEVDLTRITGKVPVAMFVGLDDDLGDKTDASWARDEIKKGGDAIDKGFYGEYELGHASFMVAKDFSYFNKVKEVLAQHNKITTSDEELYFLF
jgi:lysosomal acid lipase/cholesteryl ester hydrolase